VSSPLVIFGNAEIASLARFYFDHDSDHRVVAFTVDDDYVTESSFEGLPVIPFSEVVSRYPPAEANMHVALSYSRMNRLRQEKYEQALAGGYALPSYVCSKSATWPDLAIGQNCFVLENQTIQPTTRLGNNVMLWSGNHIGHGTFIGDHTYVSSHVVISGHCQIGERCFLGVNATLRDFLTIGDECFITMGANIVKNLEAGSVALGDSATILDPDDRKAVQIRKKYFGI
jgi:sugar O-acyltransferase (sialic acid O-acetyltransferase NeuD family)